MDELTLGLIGAGAVVVGGVVVYNAWQGAKVRRRMPRPMPEEAAEAMNRPERDEELPFIEPVRQPVRREPAAPVAAATAAAETARVEPTFGGAAPADTPADLQAEATGVDTSAESSEPAAGEEAVPAATHDAAAEP
ncbi:cell division protein FtsZ, partial [Burkholderia cenocepacia]|nr:cell division protein FtsZ [Burkholderia cenocepacia]